MTYRLALALLILWNGTAVAVLPPSAYERQRDAAPFHVAMTIEKVSAPAASRGTCQVSGPITALYRNRGRRLKVGQRITVYLACNRRGAQRRVGPSLGFNLRQLRLGRTLRAYLNRRFGVAAHGSGSKITDN